ncbi:MAG TPA: hypothetical protein VFX16_29415 [Pseudonocardiaceae bacterium]|nr:hypothetical protein [Pseudonocardiaceae bacterium]
MADTALPARGRDVHINVNLWTGVPMLLVAIFFALWAGLRPVAPPVSPGAGSADGTAQRG